MKMKLLFFFVTAAVYPLLVGAVALIVRLINFSAGTDPAGAGMARGFTFIYSSIFVCIVWFILSIVLAQVYFRAWWIGLLAPVTVAIILQGSFSARTTSGIMCPIPTRNTMRTVMFAKPGKNSGSEGTVRLLNTVPTARSGLSKLTGMGNRTALASSSTLMAR